MVKKWNFFKGATAWEAYRARLVVLAFHQAPAVRLLANVWDRS